jgi:cholesterol transport system auxiliary component
MTQTSSIISAILLSALLAGCNAFNKPLSTAQHDLGPLTEITPHDDLNAEKRMTLSAPEWLNDTRLRYRQLYKAPTLVKAYSLDRWVAPPTQLLRRYFASLPLPPETQLFLHVIDFEQQFDSAHSAKSLFSFSVELFGKDKKSISTRFFRLEEINESADAHGAIKSFVSLTRQAKIELINWLSQTDSASAN